jgi:CRAL/TRIO, N-terminal domain
MPNHSLLLTSPFASVADCLTPSQTRALLSLWARFFAACTIAPLPPAPEDEEASAQAQAQDSSNTPSGIDSESDAAAAYSSHSRAASSSNGAGTSKAGNNGSAGRSTFAATRERLARNAAATKAKAGKVLPGGSGKDAGTDSPGATSSGVNSASASTSDLNAQARAAAAGRSTTPPPGGNARSRGASEGGTGLPGVKIGGGKGDSPSRIELMEGQRSSALRTTDASGKPLVEDYTSGKHIPRDDRAKDNLRLIEEAKEMRIFLDRYGGERLREVFWRGLVKGEHPDGVMLRFLRSRKWDVDRALNVIGSTARFRVE